MPRWRECSTTRPMLPGQTQTLSGRCPLNTPSMTPNTMISAPSIALDINPMLRVGRATEEYTNEYTKKNIYIFLRSEFYIVLFILNCCLSKETLCVRRTCTCEGGHLGLSCLNMRPTTPTITVNSVINTWASTPDTRSAEHTFWWKTLILPFQNVNVSKDVECP